MYFVIFGNPLTLVHSESCENLRLSIDYRPVTTFMNMKTKIFTHFIRDRIFLNDSYAKGIMGALFVYPGQTQATLTLIESREEGPLLDFFESLDLPD